MAEGEWVTVDDVSDAFGARRGRADAFDGECASPLQLAVDETRRAVAILDREVDDYARLLRDIYLVRRIAHGDMSVLSAFNAKYTCISRLMGRLMDLADDQYLGDVSYCKDAAVGVRNSLGVLARAMQRALLRLKRVLRDTTEDEFPRERRVCRQMHEIIRQRLRSLRTRYSGWVR
ncbi:Hypothetical Protein FCC1311_048372 [Hondaea fermentalgiana]|uniref:Uncharacterized protein n=1 Tax=Hondaea fermentalgiana TaxID=2315210 RepID=A0A2R5GCA7_9STRA|nr:Hypothetical Protein FCC1311_048372 [Hondaea fermentalgiana]|eukprot:GBG28616.1 Hypothetical Protein FCC1311_048372 [Hondaea fermentalgiana]